MRREEGKATGRLWDEEGRPQGTESQAQGGAVKALEGPQRSAPRPSVLHRQPVPRGASHRGLPPTLPEDGEPRLCARGQPHSEAQALCHLCHHTITQSSVSRSCWRSRECCPNALHEIRCGTCRLICVPFFPHSLFPSMPSSPWRRAVASGRPPT